MIRVERAIIQILRCNIETVLFFIPFLFSNFKKCYYPEKLFPLTPALLMSFMQPEAALAVHSPKKFDLDLFFIAPFYHR